MTKNLKKIKISKRPYDYECGDGCCSENGFEWRVDGELVHSSPCEDSGMLAVLTHLGIDADMVFEDKDGEEVSSL